MVVAYFLRGARLCLWRRGMVPRLTYKGLSVSVGHTNTARESAPGHGENAIITRAWRSLGQADQAPGSPVRPCEEWVCRHGRSRQRCDGSNRARWRHLQAYSPFAGARRETHQRSSSLQIVPAPVARVCRRTYPDHLSTRYLSRTLQRVPDGTSQERDAEAHRHGTLQ